MSEAQPNQVNVGGRFLQDVMKLLEVIGVDSDQHAAKGSGTYDERRTIARERNVHTRRALQIALRCISLARWIAQARPDHPAWSDLTGAVDEFYSVFFHGKPAVGRRMLALVQVDAYADQALCLRHTRARARSILGIATPEDRKLLGRIDSDALQCSAKTNLGDTPTAEQARQFVQGRAEKEDFPEMVWADTLLFSLKKDGVGRLPAVRRAKALKIAIELLRAWPSKGGVSPASRDSHRTSSGGKWALAADLIEQIGLGKVDPESLRQQWQAWLRERDARTAVYRDNL